MHNSESHVVWISADSRLLNYFLKLFLSSLRFIRHGASCRESYVMSVEVRVDFFEQGADALSLG